MLENGDDENFDKAIERIINAREKNKTVISILILISAFSLLFLLAQFLQDFETKIIDTSSNELPSEDEIKDFSIPEIIYKSFEDRLTKNKNENFKIMTSVEKFNNMNFVKKNKELANIQKILRSNEIEKECSKNFHQLSSTIYCRKG